MEMIEILRWNKAEELKQRERFLKPFLSIIRRLHYFKMFTSLFVFFTHALDQLREFVPHCF